MAMMRVRIVLVPVRHRLVTMSVAMSRFRRPRPRMLMLVVNVVLVLVLVVQRLVEMGMQVMLGQMKPHTRGHQQSRRPELPRHRLVEHQH